MSRISLPHVAITKNGYYLTWVWWPKSEKLCQLACKFDLNQSEHKSLQINASARRSWPNWVKSRPKFSTCVYSLQYRTEVTQQGMHHWNANRTLWERQRMPNFDFSVRLLLSGTVPKSPFGPKSFSKTQKSTSWLKHHFWGKYSISLNDVQNKMSLAYLKD